VRTRPCWRSTSGLRRAAITSRRWPTLSCTTWPPSPPCAWATRSEPAIYGARPSS
jgi:hypothetical protein